MMRVLVWVTEVGWEAAVDAARGAVGPNADVTLLHVTPAEVEEAAEAPRRGLLGRRPPPPPGHGPPPPPPGHRPPHPDVRAALGEEADAILAAAAEHLGRPAERHKRTGRPEREVLDEAAGHDLLVLSRDGAPSPGPASLAPWARFVLDHAQTPVLLASPR
jgi:nucleotide-binding universal stress UspA family protein